MRELSENAKKEYLKYIGSDGKFIINDKVPVELIETFKFFNDNNISVLDFKLQDIEREEEIDDSFIDEDILDVENNDDIEKISSDLNDFF